MSYWGTSLYINPTLELLTPACLKNCHIRPYLMALPCLKSTLNPHWTRKNWLEEGGACRRGVPAPAVSVCMRLTEDMSSFFFLLKLHLNLSDGEVSISCGEEKRLFHVCTVPFFERVDVVDLQEVIPDSGVAPSHLTDLTPNCSLLPKPRATLMTWARCYR